MATLLPLYSSIASNAPQKPCLRVQSCLAWLPAVVFNFCYAICCLTPSGSAGYPPRHRYKAITEYPRPLCKNRASAVGLTPSVFIHYLEFLLLITEWPHLSAYRPDPDYLSHIRRSQSAHLSSEKSCMRNIHRREHKVMRCHTAIL